MVALALSLDTHILTGGEDFFGCGVAVWTVDTLAAQIQGDPLSLEDDVLLPANDTRN